MYCRRRGETDLSEQVRSRERNIINIILWIASLTRRGFQG